MSKNSKDIFDTIDEYFSQVNGEEIAKKINEGVNTFSKNLSETIEDSLKNSGYNNFSEFVEGEIKDQKGKKPEFSKYLKEFSSRKEYVKEAIQQVDYEIKYRGYYKEGHQQALKDIEPLIDKYAYNLDELSKQIQMQIKEIKARNSSNRKTYTNGYIGGCEYIQKAIKRSKRLMMDRIMNEINA